MNLRIVHLLGLGLLALPSQGLAITQGRISQFNGLAASIKNGSIKPEKIFEKIKELQISPGEMNERSVQAMDTIAVEKLKAAGLVTSNNKKITSAVKLTQAPQMATPTTTRTGAPVGGRTTTATQAQQQPTKKFTEQPEAGPTVQDALSELEAAWKKFGTKETFTMTELADFALAMSSLNRLMKTPWNGVTIEQTIMDYANIKQLNDLRLIFNNAEKEANERANAKAINPPQKKSLSQTDNDKILASKNQINDLWTRFYEKGTLGNMTPEKQKEFVDGISRLVLTLEEKLSTEQQIGSILSMTERNTMKEFNQLVEARDAFLKKQEQGPQKVEPSVPPYSAQDQKKIDEVVTKINTLDAQFDTKGRDWRKMGDDEQQTFAYAVLMIDRELEQILPSKRSLRAAITSFDIWTKINDLDNAASAINKKFGEQKTVISSKYTQQPQKVEALKTADLKLYDGITVEEAKKVINAVKAYYDLYEKDKTNQTAKNVFMQAFSESNIAAMIQRDTIKTDAGKHLYIMLQMAPEMMAAASMKREYDHISQEKASPTAAQPTGAAFLDPAIVEWNTSFADPKANYPEVLFAIAQKVKGLPDDPYLKNLKPRIDAVVELFVRLKDLAQEAQKIDANDKQQVDTFIDNEKKARTLFSDVSKKYPDLTTQLNKNEQLKMLSELCQNKMDELTAKTKKATLNTLVAQAEERITKLNETYKTIPLPTLGKEVNDLSKALYLEVGKTRVLEGLSDKVNKLFITINDYYIDKSETPKQKIARAIENVQEAIAIEWEAQKKNRIGVNGAMRETFHEKLLKQQNKYRELTDPKDQKAIAPLLAKAFNQLYKLDLFAGEEGVEPLMQFASPEEVETFIQSKGFKKSLMQDLIEKKISQDNYTIIDNTRTALMRLANKINSAGTIIREEDIDDMTNTLEGLSGGKMMEDFGGYLGDFDRKNITTVRNYIDKTKEEKKKLKEIGKSYTDTEKAIEQSIAKLETDIKTAMAAVTPNSTTVSDIDFANQYKKIKDLIASMPASGKVDQFYQRAKDCLSLFMAYAGQAYVVWEGLSRTLWRQINEGKKAGGTITAEAQGKMDDLGRMIDDAKGRAEALTNQFMPFVADAEKDILADAASVSKANFIKILNGIPDEQQRMGIINSILAEFYAKLAGAGEKLLKNEFMPIEDFAQYQDKINAALSSGKFSEAQRKVIQEAWNKRLKDYSNHLLDSIKAYSDIHNLPNLHKVASESTPSIASSINNIIAEAPFNTIARMLDDLGDYLDSDLIAKTSVSTGLWQNFAYMLAAFDGFTYALFKQEIKAEKGTGLWAWLWSRIGYTLLNVNETPEAFEQKYQTILSQFMEKIANSIQIYRRILLNKIVDKKAALFDSGTLNIIADALNNEDAAKKAGLLKADGSYIYAAKIDTPIQFPGVAPIQASIDDITALHKKDKPYAMLLQFYGKIIAGAYNNPDWIRAAKLNEKYQEQQKFAQTHDAEVKRLTNQIATIEANLGKQMSTYATLGLRKQLQDAKELWKTQWTNLEAEYKKIKATE
jgi:hypothetical protein